MDIKFVQGFHLDLAHFSRILGRGIKTCMGFIISYITYREPPCRKSTLLSSSTHFGGQFSPTVRMTSLNVASLFYDGPESVTTRALDPKAPADSQNRFRYKRRLHTDYRLPQVTLKQIHEAIPKHAYERNTLKGFYYVARDIFFAAIFYVRPCWLALVYQCDVFAHTSMQQLAKHIEPTALSVGAAYGEHAQFFAKWGMWSMYWWWQGICWAGIWTLGHEVGNSILE